MNVIKIEIMGKFGGSPRCSAAFQFVEFGNAVNFKGAAHRSFIFTFGIIELCSAAYWASRISFSTNITVRCTDLLHHLLYSNNKLKHNLL